MISICVHCKASFELEDDFNGQSFDCPVCGKTVVAEPIKNCKYCNMEIPQSATKCIHCEKSQISIGIRQSGRISSTPEEEKTQETPKADRPKIGIRKPGERSVSAEEPANKPAEPVKTTRKIGVLKPGERSTLPPEPEQTIEVPASTPETVEKEIPDEIQLKAPGAPMNENHAPAAVPVEEEIPQKPQKIALKLPGTSSTTPPPAAPAVEGGAPKLNLNLPGKAPSVGGAPKLNLPGKAPSVGGGAPKLNLPGKASSVSVPATSAPAAEGGAPKLTLPGKAPSVGGGAPKLNLPGKAPVVSAPAVAAPTPVVKKAVAVQTAVPPPLPVVASQEENTTETDFVEPVVKPKKDVGKIVAIILCTAACLILLSVLIAGIYMFFFSTPSGGN